MLAPPEPADEIDRIAALCRLHVLDTPADDRFDRITRIAQRLFHVPIALVSLVDGERQWFKSRAGLGTQETPRNISFCGHAILEERPFIIHDALADPRFADNPLVTGPPHLRFYAGIPIHEAGGWRVGTLCLIDTSPRAFSVADVAALKDLARWAETELNLYSLEQATAITREKEARLQAIVEHAGDAIVTIDDGGMVETFNPAAQRMFGYRADEVVARPVAALAARHYRDTITQMVTAMARDGLTGTGPANRQVFAQRRDGSRFPANLVVSEMRIGQRRAFTALVRDISERRRSSDDIKRLNRHLAETLGLQQAILDSTDYAIIAVNSLGQVTMFNAGAQRMLGYTEAEMRTQDKLRVLHDPAELAARVAQLSQELNRPIRAGAEMFIAKALEGKRDDSEWTYIRKDGTRLPVMLSVSAVWDERHELAGFVGIAQDLSERKKIEQLKNEFISTLSHELRTPLTSIRGSLGLLAGGAAGEIPPKAHTLLDVANKNCDRLVRLINDILDVEKIESGSMRFDAVVQPLLPLVEQAVAATTAYANNYQVSFDVRSDRGDIYVAVDADRLTQVIVNLLSNASKFAPSGDVVEVRLRRRQHSVRLSVIDHGVGIPDAFRDRIFQKFAQADGTDKRAKGGTGLGLNITKAIVEKHCGTIDFISEPGIRTEFYFDLPLASAPHAA
ncbi:PAS domain S-box protein [Massilia sp. CF038]|uniref:PAS domain S-box protein n=1 Tax=Massilia sp. CF038 TaxID=1881045 RepID=UPI000918D47C|nr:PAS domain S-box protein [Massilia sp. CF038]SHH54040.1 PAS domain S-box-containing protein [Massilia sp. CF038]